MSIETQTIEKGGFTMPGEAGYEDLTLSLAKQWGADVIRDSDGTKLSDEIVNAGYGIYSTICLIREHNEWAKSHPEQLQQTFLMTAPMVATDNMLTIELMKDFFTEQFTINDSPEAMAYWQVYDRTTNEELAADAWSYDAKTGCVTITKPVAFHKYTVSFLAYRIWEEISMYNHLTNNWEKEHLMQIDPRHPETADYLLKWMETWCQEHPDTTVVRFTSMFYNFVWIWGSDERNRSLYSDWASYDFTVSPLALNTFEKEYGYRLTAEDFINQGKLHVTHMPCDQKKKDWMTFVNQFVIELGKKLIAMAHQYGKKAYVFYDDSWVGVEPYNGRFEEFGFDGLIKCVFSGYEARLCAGVNVETHELRLHPYLFPVGLGGAPTFMEGGDPTTDAKNYWNSVRRALLREPIDRIGLGGYIHLVEKFPDFTAYIGKIADEFRSIKALHHAGKPYTIKTKVAVLHFWGKLRSWSLSGHFHETYMHDLIHVNEALSGLPVEVSFIDFEDVKKGRLSEFDVVINAGNAGSAWSGGDAWLDEEVVTRLTQWVFEGGTFIGINEPSAVQGYDTYFRMAHVLGIDEDTGAKVCHGKWQYTVEEELAEKLIPAGASLRMREHRYLTDGSTKVLMSQDGEPVMTEHAFGAGKGIYLASFQVNNANTKLLLNTILYAGGEALDGNYLTDNANMECAYYQESDTLVVINNSDVEQKTRIHTPSGEIEVTVPAFDTLIRMG